MQLSIILPTYNEAENIFKLLEELKLVFEGVTDFEMIIVDDMSTDQTVSEVQNFQEKYQNGIPVRIVERDNNFRSLGASIGDGLKAAIGESILVMDSDFTHQPFDALRLYNTHCSNLEIVLGSRFIPGGGMESKTHYFFSKIFNLAIKIILNTGVNDNLGGFFVANSAQIRQVAKVGVFRGYGDYYFRLISNVRESGADIHEVSTHYAARQFGRSKSNFLKLIFSYSWEVMKFYVTFRITIRVSNFKDKHLRKVTN